MLGIGFQRPEIGGALEHTLQEVDVDGFGEIVEGPELDRPDGVDPVAVAGDDDHLGRRRCLHNLVQRVQAFLGAVLGRGQAEVQAHEFRMVRGHRGECGASVLGEEEGEVVAQRILELRADTLVIFDYEQSRFARAHGGRSVFFPIH